METKPKFICPLLVVSDMQRSRNFYETVLHQEVIYDFGENVTFKGNFAIHQQQHFQMLIDGKEIRTGGNNFEIYFEFDNVEEITNQLKTAGINFVHEMREQPWRQRVVRFYDPDNHIIEVGESMEYLSYRISKEGRTVEEISKMILMPIDFIKAGIEKYETK